MSSPILGHPPLPGEGPDNLAVQCRESGATAAVRSHEVEQTFGRVQCRESGATATVRGIFGKESPPCLVCERPRPHAAHSKARRALRIPAFAHCGSVLGTGESCEIALSEGSPRHGGGFLPAAPVFVVEGIVLAALGGARRQACHIRLPHSIVFFYE